MSFISRINLTFSITQLASNSAISMSQGAPIHRLQSIKVLIYFVGCPLFRSIVLVYDDIFVNLLFEFQIMSNKQC